MKIDFVEISNFRKLLSVRIDFAPEKTVFVGANNSGKTSAMVALQLLLVSRERPKFSIYDLTLSHCVAIDEMGKSWEAAAQKKDALPTPNWDSVLPSIDLWLRVADDEVHYVQRILPTLEWQGGCVGLRLRLQPRDATKLQAEYLKARADAQVGQVPNTSVEGIESDASTPTEEQSIDLWPRTLTDFLRRRLGQAFEVRAFILDPEKLEEPLYGVARPQKLAPEEEPVEGDPLRGLIRIDEIGAQRGFSEGERTVEEEETQPSGSTSARKLTAQLRGYYNRHLDPFERPQADDLQALRAIERAQKEFDKRLKDGFKDALTEMETLGYPGIANPRLSISTQLRPIDGLKHEAAVQYLVPFSGGSQSTDLFLPEETNGLGYQNLISMVFRLMSFRDAWMRVKKAQGSVAANDEAFTPPLHLVLVEEPEAYLHTQVQQAFIRQAYNVLRNHSALKKKESRLSTQLIVSTHSSHVAHECDFASLRYFRRRPAQENGIPTSVVVNLSEVFGSEDDTARFVTRYLKATHCDLFFADAAVLVEGPAERILVPYFVTCRPEFLELSHAYVTWLELGGSHAHRFRRLIEHLGLTTLIIGDIDAVGAGNKKAVPQRGKSLKTRNSTMKSWIPGVGELDALLDLPEEKKVKGYVNENFAVRIAYQSPVQIVFKTAPSEALANTLEDAILFENVELFETWVGAGLAGDFKAAIAESATVGELSEKAGDLLKEGDKAGFAMDLLELPDQTKLIPPKYIREGLLWLSKQISREQGELGLPMIVETSPSPAAGNA